jgi:hypothetical protein
MVIYICTKGNTSGKGNGEKKNWWEVNVVKAHWIHAFMCEMKPIVLPSKRVIEKLLFLKFGQV